jgi:hypothetical protein
MNRALLFFPVVGPLGLALVACGGEDEGRPSGEHPSTAPLDPCTADDGFEFQNIVNFEPREQGGNVNPNVACDPTIPCSFYYNYDDVQSPPNPGHTMPLPRGAECEMQVDPDAVVFMEPRAKQSTFRGQEIEDGRCDMATSGLRVIAENVGMCYGPDGRLGWGAALDITFTVALDATEWDGIGFWIRKSTAGKVAVNVSVADPFTSGGAINPVTGVAYCNAMDPPAGTPPIPDTKKCDAFGIAVTLTEEWSFIPARFGAMRQKGFGVPSVLGYLDTEHISRVQVLMSAGSWDLWLDDFALFREPE